MPLPLRVHAGLECSQHRVLFGGPLGLPNRVHLELAICEMDLEFGLGGVLA